MKIYTFSLILFFFFNCFAHVKQVGSTNCDKISGTPGPEDLAIDRESGLLYISSHERRIPNQIGFLFSLDLKKDSKTPIKIETNYPEKFSPHGIFFGIIGGVKKIYAISHPKLIGGNEHTIEIFRIEKDKVVHESTLKDALLLSPNDLYVTQNGKIYVSNDIPGGKSKQLFDAALKLNSSPISYYNGKEWTLLKEKTAFGNGIHIKKENGKEYLYRASTVGEFVLKYEILNSQNSNPDLKLIQKIDLESGADNIEEEENGNLLVAAHKSSFRFLAHAGNKEKTSPTQIFRIFPDGKFKEIYANDGDIISGASTGISYNNRLIISQVFEPFLLSCPLE